MSAATPPTVRVALLPSLISPDELRPTVAVVIDQLRATTTITQALASGARWIVPLLDPESALRHRAGFGPGECVTGGERKGVLIEGFDHDNSPRAYTPEAVGGRVIAFTTTNGTAAMHHAACAKRVLLACLGNLSAVVGMLVRMGEPVAVVCAGTLGRVTQEDALVGALIAEALVAKGYRAASDDPRADDDTATMLLAWARSHKGNAEAVANVVRRSRGGRNLARIGLDADVEFCTRMDVWPVVPEYLPAQERIVRATD